MKTLTVTKCELKDFDMIKCQEAMKYLQAYVTPEYRAALVSEPFSYTIRANDRVVFIGGVYRMWEGRGEAWAIFDENCKTVFLSIHREVKKYLNLIPTRRIEATVDCDFVAGNRLMKTLGFKCEAPRMKYFRQDGRDVALYSYIKEGG